MIFVGNDICFKIKPCGVSGFGFGNGDVEMIFTGFFVKGELCLTGIAYNNSGIGCAVVYSVCFGGNGVSHGAYEPIAFL